MRRVESAIACLCGYHMGEVTEIGRPYHNERIKRGDFNGTGYLASNRRHALGSLLDRC